MLGTLGDAAQASLCGNILITVVDPGIQRRGAWAWRILRSTGVAEKTVEAGQGRVALGRGTANRDGSRLTDLQCGSSRLRAPLTAWSRGRSGVPAIRWPAGAP